MASLLDAFISCITGREPHTAIYDDEKQPLSVSSTHQPRTTEEVAEQVVQALIHTEKGGAHLERTLDDIVGEYGWTEKVAGWVLAKLEAALREAEKLQGPLKDAYNKACDAALATEGFAKEHPVFVSIFVTVVALGVLVVIAPWVLEALGFAELGPIEDSFAAVWQRSYDGYVPKASLFSFFQRLGMVWH